MPGDAEGRQARTSRPPEPARRPAAPAGSPAAPAVPAILRLQSGAGNGAVSALLGGTVQRLAGDPLAPPAPVTPRTPSADPAFRAVTAKVSAASAASTRHPPAKSEAAAASRAAKAPPGDKEAQAKAEQAGEMAAAKPGGFDKAAFIAAVNEAVARQAPQNLDEADRFATSGKADAVKAEVAGTVGKGKEQSAKPLADAAAKSPDTAHAVDKPVTPLPPPTVAPPPAVDASAAAPAPAPAQQTELRAGQHETEQTMVAAGVTEQQLATANEPQFAGALAAKKAGEQHAAKAPAAVRAAEQQTLTAARSDAAAAGHQSLEAMHAVHGRSGQQVGAHQSAAQAHDEAKRVEITTHIAGVFDATKKDVEAILTGLDGLVSAAFDEGERAAKAAFTADHQARMKKYKDERYSGVSGALRWTADLFTGLPAEGRALFQEAKKVYVTRMQGVITQIADLVGRELGKAKDRVAAGRAEIARYVASQPKELQKVAADAEKEIGGRFAELESSIEEKSSALVDDLAAKYVAASQTVDAEIKQLQEESKGLWDKAKEAVGGAIETILQLKNMLLGVLARAAGAAEKIISDPIGFLGNLVGAVKAGVVNFGANIVTHLKEGLKAWLFGNLAAAGIEIPEKLDVRGILAMVLSILGLTWANVRQRILKVIPEPVLKVLETTVDVVKLLVTEGLPGLWRWVVEKLGDLKEMVLGQIKDFVIERIVKAGITWIIGLLNPAAAFIKACKAIYDVVMFFVEKAAQVKEFVDSVLDSIESIAGGGVGAVAGLIERALAKALPMVIGFLASLLGLGGISEKIKSILEKVQAPVNKVIDGVVGTVVKAGKKLMGKLGRDKGDDTPEGKQKRLDAGMTAAVSVLNRFGGRTVTAKVVAPLLAVVKLRHRMTALTVRAQDGHWLVEGKVNPEQTRPSSAIAPTAAAAREALSALGLPQAAVDRVMKKGTEEEKIKGLILEEVHAAQMDAAEDAQPPATTEPTKRFVPGRSIRLNGAELSDGIEALVWKEGHDHFIQILALHEVKSSAERKRDLARVREPWKKASQADKREAEDAVIEDLTRGMPSSTSMSRRRQEASRTHTPDEIAHLTKRRFEESEYLGQHGMSLERLDPPRNDKGTVLAATTLTIGGVEYTVKDFTRNVKAVGVVPSDVSAGRTVKAMEKQVAGGAELKKSTVDSARLREVAKMVAEVNRAT